MKVRLLKFLICPFCKAQLNLTKSKIVKRHYNEKQYPENLICQRSCSYKSQGFGCKECLATEIVEGTLICTKCQRTYKIVDSIPRMVGSHTPRWDSFSYYQNTFAGFDKSRMDTVFKTLLPSKAIPTFLKNKIILDAGCGRGFFINTIAKSKDVEIIGVDTGACIDEAFQLNQELPNVHIIQADMDNIPFGGAIFDFIYSTYVIHYLQNSEKTFMKLVQLVKPNGRLTVSVYPKKNSGFTIMQKIIRSITTKLPSKLLFYLCFIPVPLLAIFKTSSGALPKNQGWTKCASLLYSFYAPKQFRQFSEKEVLRWFRKAGFGNLESLVHPVTITGVKINRNERGK